ncbi:MAG: RagB/SusD family nutrient uptake outer membrane protein [Bacteroidales bacterium]|nr:RagB/SusD family nutrient uptake outer membrane protein [Bacteroidales bacterium]MCB9000274.1 RagB/SusD family nutrient uptake outer membrane protein [Bacteroidales bacterium]MCB9012822.1 RagB/SusD family nutrient uptake outer membrane protein [Bacteroidales bacterium]
MSKYNVSLSIKIGFLSLLFLLPLQSCEDYFTIEPVSLYSQENVFTTVDFTLQAILGVYQVTTLDEGFSKRLSMYYACDNDAEMCSGTTLDNGRRDIARYSANSGNTEIEKPWINLYKGINRANICIENIPKSPVYTSGSDQDIVKMNRMLGEAITLRALFYYELIINWGDVPFNDTPTRSGDNYFLPKTDRDVIYDFIINDLKKAVDLVPWRSEVSLDERITKGAVKGFLARVALARGGYSLRKSGGNQRGSNYLDYYTIARDQCAEIIASGEHKLNPDFSNIFHTMCEWKLDSKYGESMWELGMGQFRSGEVGYYVGSRSDGNSRYGKADGGINPLPTYYLSFDSLDTRRDVTIALYEIDGDNNRLLRKFTETYIAKWRREWMNPLFPGTDKYNGINWVLLRYSDVLLMFAEADNELNNGPSAAAIDAFRLVRERAFKGNVGKMPAIPTDYQGFFNEIVKEREWEFGGECIRKFDLIRWNLLGTKIAETKENLAKLYNGEPPYDKVPRKLVWRNEGENLKILNLNTPMDSAQIADRDSILWPNVYDWADNVTPTYTSIFAGYFEPDKKELLPIHQSIIDKNPNLTPDFGN